MHVWPPSFPSRMSTLPAMCHAALKDWVRLFYLSNTWKHLRASMNRINYQFSSQLVPHAVCIDAECDCHTSREVPFTQKREGQSLEKRRQYLDVLWWFDLDRKDRRRTKNKTHVIWFLESIWPTISRKQHLWSSDSYQFTQDSSEQWHQDSVELKKWSGKWKYHYPSWKENLTQT